MSTDLTDPILRPPGAAEYEEEFWGADADWRPTSPTPGRQRSSTERSGTERSGTERSGARWWQRTLATGSSARRTHGAPPRSSVSARDRRPTGQAHLDDTDPLDRDDFLATRFADDAMDWDVDSWDLDEWETELAADDPSNGAVSWADDWRVETRPVAVPRRHSIDTRLARIGLLTIVLTLVVATAMALTSNDAADDVLAEATPQPEVAAQVPTEANLAPTEERQSASTAANNTSAASATDAAVATTPSAAPPTAALTPVTEPEPATTAAACASKYEIASGDYWIRIADAAGVRLADLLAVNGATIDTLLVPGRSICLPAGASTPAPPSRSSATPTTAAPSTATPTTATPTTAAPRTTTATPTTAAPTTAAPTTAATPAAPADVEAIIRSVWPDSLEEQALAIAWRESNYVPTAKNYCCYGLFQIYWTVHKGWLDDMGVTSADQLFDPLTNARAAYALYQRAGGFGPWGG